MEGRPEAGSLSTMDLCLDYIESPGGLTEFGRCLKCKGKMADNSARALELYRT